MYERFTDRARKVIRLATHEAQRHNNDFVGTQHLLLGLIKEGSGVAGNILMNFDVDLGKARREVAMIVESAPHSGTPVTGTLPQTARLKKVIDYAIEEANSLKHNYIGTEHLLLGLLREPEGIGVQILKNLSVKPDEVREEVLRALGYSKSESPPALRTRAEIEARLQTERAMLAAIEEASGDRPAESVDVISTLEWVLGEHD